MLCYFRNCMKTFALLLCIASMLLATSCNKCAVCTKYPAKDIELCKKDFASDDSYNMAFRQTEAMGYDCK
jgi:hypothetical protein